MSSVKETLKLIDDISKKYHISKPYLVGGLPRDIYLKEGDIKTADLDITTNSKDVLRLGILTAYELNVTFELSEDGHITVYADNFDLDFSSNFISESVKEYFNGKNTNKQEAYSRDFTINTLHQDLITGKIIDVTGTAFDDINNKIIKTPVPPHITMNDDPRRAYRAINLAVRYGFDIDDELKKFILDNPELFTQEKIKDKYISAKMIAALKVDAKKTISLLKELNLFKNVPLVGFFKDTLISNRLLTDYLDEASADDGWKPKNSNNTEASMSILNKIAFIAKAQESMEDVPLDVVEPKTDSTPISAKSWSEYSNISPEHKALAEFWKNNSQKITGENSSYYGFTRWYWSQFNNKWGKQHRDPGLVLNQLNKELISQQSQPEQYTESKDGKSNLNDINHSEVTQYPPFSQKAADLFAQAARAIGAPVEWASDPALHNILKKESNGWVGIPNYKYGERAKDKSKWHIIHDELKSGKPGTKYTATGLGQLILGNVKKYYPNGVWGIGDPLDEACGMLNYIRARYKTPKKAWERYNKEGFEGY